MTKLLKYIPSLLTVLSVAAITLPTGCGFMGGERGVQLDSLQNDSVARAQKLLQIDTCTAYFRRHTWADKKHNITFDRIEILSDSAAREYAATRHGFEGRKHIIINLEPTTATLSVSDTTEIWIVNPAFKTGKSKEHYIRGKVGDVADFGYNTIIKLATQNKNVLYIKQLDIEL